MVRPRLCRRIGLQPNVTYFKPAGIRLVELEEVILTVDEFEAVRLKDLEGLDQDKSAKKMNISQPTFHRLVSSARKKIADALVNGRAIKIEGGNYKMVNQNRRGMRKRIGFRSPPISCICLVCGYEEGKAREVPCATKKCPKCKIPMVRGD